MLQRNRRRLIATFLAATVVAGLTLTAPSALAQPDVAPPPAPVDPFGFPPPPAPAPAASQPVDPLAVIPGQPMPIPEGTPGGQNPNPFVG